MRVADVLPVPTPLEPVDRPETVGAPAARRRGGLVGRINVVGWRVIALAAFLVVWHLASIPAGKLLLPSPLDIVPAFIDEVRSGQLVTATLSSLQVFAVGYLLAIVTGVAFGVLMGGMPRLGETLEIYVNALNATPRVALIPFIILWFGLGTNAKIVVVWFQAVMPILINTNVAFRQVDPALREAAYGMGMNTWQVLQRVEFPLALPVIIAGLRTATVEVIASATLATFIGVSTLGLYINQGLQESRTDLMLAGAIPVALLTLGAELLLGGAERLTRRG